MNRRSFLKSLGVLAGASMLPTWLDAPTIPEIPLEKFCGVEFRKWDVSTPFVQANHIEVATFATDARICLKVPSLVLPDGEPASHPPVFRLGWGNGGVWRPWPRKRYIVTDDAECWECDGDGFVVVDGNAYTCHQCDGRGEGMFPDIQEIGGKFIDARYDAKIRRYLTGLEFCIVEQAPPCNYKLPPQQLVRFRFRGGDGMLCVLDSEMTAKRIKKKRTAALPFERNSALAMCFARSKSK